MKSYEIKRIGTGSVFKFYFVIGVVVGLITCIVILITGASLSQIGIQLGTFSLKGGGPLQVGGAVAGLVIGSLAYGLLTGIAGSIMALIYNVFAAAVGGIIIKLNDKE